MISINIFGLAPALTGENWFLFDKSGTFSIDKNISAAIYLVGGGCDGKDGFNNSGIVHGGDGGSGGKIVKLKGLRLKKNVAYTVAIAESNDISGTNIAVNGAVYSCDRQGCFFKTGGFGGIQTIYGTAANPQNGSNGILTPYGYVGSSGGGGLACSERGFTSMSYGGIGAGGSMRHFHPEYTPVANIPLLRENNALNYGCGGGGNTFCSADGEISPKSKGRQGCVIIEWTEIEIDDNSPDFSVSYFKNSSGSDTETRNSELRRQIAELKAQIAEIESKVTEI